MMFQSAGGVRSKPVRHMCAKWNDKFDPHPLLKRLSVIADVTTGKVQFHNTCEAHDHRAVLLDSIEMHPEIPEEDKRKLTHNAIVKVLLAGTPTSVAMLAAASECERQFLSKPRQPY